MAGFSVQGKQRGCCLLWIHLIAAEIFSSLGRGRTDTSRQVTLWKGLIKKAYAVLYDGLLTVVFSSRVRLHECANNSDKKMVKLLIVTAIFLGTHLAPVNSSTTTAYWELYCAGGNFTPSSTYARSLDKIAAELPKRAASSPSLFAGFHSGEVHALAQCRGDSTASACGRCTARCLQDATKVLCPFKQDAVVFSDMCTVAYSQKELLQYPTGNELDITASKSDLSPVILQSATFNTSVLELAKAVARRTAISPARFGTGKKEVVQEQYRLTIYGLGQCLPNLSDEDCRVCLQDLVYAIDFSVDMTTGRVAKVWCNYRFALYKFFRGKPALDLPGEGLPKQRGKKHQNDENTTMLAAIVAVLGTLSTLLVVAVAVLGTLLVLLVVAGLVYWWRNRNQQKKWSGKEVQCTEKVVELQAVPCRSALEAFQEIVDLANNKEIAVFLDYDGTLSPIVNDPEKAFMSSEMRQVVQSIADNFKTSIVSGRAVEKVFDFVQINTINYAGSHGEDIKMASTTRDVTTSSEITEERGSYRPSQECAMTMNQAYISLVRGMEAINGAWVENNNYCVSVHYRNVAKEDQLLVRPLVKEVLKNLNSGLYITNGDMVYEVHLPGAKNKGDVVCHILDKLGRVNNTTFFSIYIGDDLTDEDAFKVIRDKNIGVGIRVCKTSRDTSAFYSLKDPPQVMEFLKLLVKWKLENIN